jgi:hypothetical protein
MMRIKEVILAALLIFLFTGLISCGDIPDDPVKAHIEKHGSGIDMTGIWNDQKSNKQLKKKNFKPGSTRRWM